jgi:hypothetical protein
VPVAATFFVLDTYGNKFRVSKIIPGGSIDNDSPDEQEGEELDGPVYRLDDGTQIKEIGAGAFEIPGTRRRLLKAD